MNFNLSTIKYKIRFLKFYILFGFIALLIEFITRYTILLIFENDFIATVLGITLGILFAYWSNVKFNFQIPQYRIKKALILFIFIGLLSKLTQSFISDYLGLDILNYEFQRIITSGLIFIIFYIINVQITFNNRTKLGIAIYANTDENVHNIYSKVKQSPDFIQIDLVDNTIFEDAVEVNLDIIEEVRDIWKDKFIELHLMSVDPKMWINKFGNLINLIDMIILHENVIDNDNKIIEKIKTDNKNMKVGIFFENSTDHNKIKNLSTLCDQVTIMGIEKLGYSGQNFNDKTLKLLKKVDKFKNRKEFILEVDGGVNSENFYKLKVDKLVSGSSVLNSSNSINKILEYKNL